MHRQGKRPRRTDHMKRDRQNDTERHKHGRLHHIFNRHRITLSIKIIFSF